MGSCPYVTPDFKDCTAVSSVSGTVEAKDASLPAISTSSSEPGQQASLIAAFGMTHLPVSTHVAFSHVHPEDQLLCYD